MSDEKKGYLYSQKWLEDNLAEEAKARARARAIRQAKEANEAMKRRAEIDRLKNELAEMKTW